MGKRNLIGILVFLLLFTGSSATAVFAGTAVTAQPQTYRIEKRYVHYRSKPQGDNTNYYITSKLPSTASDLKVKSSNPNVAAVKVAGKNSSGKYFRFAITTRKSGKAEIQLSATVGKKEIKILIKTTVVNYKNPIASLKIGDRDYRSMFSAEEKIDKDIIKAGTAKIFCKAQNGWKLEEIRKKEVVKKDGKDVIERSRLKNNSSISVGQGSEVVVEVQLYNAALDKYTAVGVQLTGKIQKPEKQVYDKIIMAGDSRTYRTYHQFGITAPNVRFIAKCGEGYVWMSSVATERLKREIMKTDGKIAVVFNFGVNDLWNIDFYLEFMNSEILRLSETARFDLYYMSVNPVSETKFSRNGYNLRNRNMAQITRFNSKLKSGLNEKYKYIDTFSYLMKYYDTEKMTLPDGLHYTQKGSQIIFDLCQAYLVNNRFKYDL